MQQTTLYKMCVVSLFHGTLQQTWRKDTYDMTDPKDWKTAEIAQEKCMQCWGKVRSLIELPSETLTNAAEYVVAADTDIYGKRHVSFTSIRWH